MIPLYDARLPPDQPQTHALVIGINAYPHLPGGALSGTQPAPKNFGLSTLTSPVISATAFTDWLLSRHNNPTAPLGSIELLLSPTVYSPSDDAAARLGVALGTALTVEEPKFSAIEAATGRWYLQANKHRDNVALFYFCGHGLEATDRYLLPMDFGASPLNWTANIINFTVTHKNMERCRAKTQCFFIDACRDKPQELRDQASGGPLGQPLIGPQPGSVVDRDAPIYHAAAPGQSAAALPGQKSFFTWALLDCMEGIGARQPVSTHAAIDHDSLGSALRELVDRLGVDHGLPLRCHVLNDAMLPQPADLHLAPVPVKVLAIVSCQPTAAHRVAHLSLRDSAGKSILRPALDERPWRLTVIGGTCVVEATFDAAAPFADCMVEKIANPPMFRLPLEITAR